MLMTAAALTVTTPHYQWYAILLVVLVALDGHPEWLAIAAGAYIPNYGHIYIHGFTVHDPLLAGYGGGAAVACSLALLRLFLTRFRTSPAAATDSAAATGSVLAATAETTEEQAEETAGERVIEPTAVIVRPAVTIGRDGMPEFAAEADPEATGSYLVLTERELPERDGRRRP
jgi:hypothetical protein